MVFSIKFNFNSDIIICDWGRQINPKIDSQQYQNYLLDLYLDTLVDLTLAFCLAWTWLIDLPVSGYLAGLYSATPDLSVTTFLLPFWLVSGHRVDLSLFSWLAFFWVPDWHASGWMPCTGWFIGLYLATLLTVFGYLLAYAWLWLVNIYLVAAGLPVSSHIIDQCPATWVICILLPIWYVSGCLVLYTATCWACKLRAN
jgi:hypothetical protein